MSSLHRLFTIFICLCAGLTACATPQTPPLPPGEGTEVRETPPSSVTLTATLTPTETLAPTSTPEPTPTPEEVGEFIPANKIEFVDALPDYNLTLAPDANIKGIYWDIIISHLGDAISKSIPENQATLAKVLEKFPEYGGIGHGADYKIKQAFMQAFLKESGGKMIITDMNWRRYEADFNQDIKLEVIHGNKLPQEYAGAMRENINDKHGRGGGFTMYVSEQGQVVYSVMFVNNTLDYTLEENGGSLYNIGNWTAGEITSDFFRKLVANTAMHSRVDLRTVNASNYKLYIKGADPDSGEFYASMYWTFIK